MFSKFEFWFNNSVEMIDFNRFYQQIAITPFAKWLEVLPTQLNYWKKKNLHINNSWYKSLKSIPLLKPQYLDLINGVIANNNYISDNHRHGIEKLLRNLMPWRKGPYLLYGININSEWRSNLKWDRILPHISSFSGRKVLDVGCGNGYYMWRIVGFGADIVIGIDPINLVFYQFEAIRKLLNDDRRIHLIPINIEQLPKLQAFDTVLSMGVLYHKRSPLDHLLHLKNQLVKGGELILETLVIKSDINETLVPVGTYAQMNNVFFIPSIKLLKNWLKKIGFINIHIADYSNTTINEQRRTDWMITNSLNDFLNPNDSTKTIEGYPSPLRAILIATKP